MLLQADHCVFIKLYDKELKKILSIKLKTTLKAVSKTNSNYSNYKIIKSLEKSTVFPYLTQSYKIYILNAFDATFCSNRNPLSGTLILSLIQPSQMLSDLIQNRLTTL